MNKEKFQYFLEENILSVFTGSEIAGAEESSPREGIVAQGSNGTILAKFKKSDEYRFVIKRVQPFKKFEVFLVKCIIEEYKSIYNSGVKTEYLDRLQEIAIEHAICKAVSTRSHDTILSLLETIDKWSQRTYEGNNLTFGFIITNKKIPKIQNKNLHFTDFLNKDFSALLTDGVNTCLEISSNGYLTGYISLPQTRDEWLQSPYNYLKIANLCTGPRVGVTLLKNRDILIFKDKALLFARKNNKWISFSHDEIINKIAEKKGEEIQDIRKALYLTALDVSFTKQGGCLVHLNKDDADTVLKHIDERDILIEKYYLAKKAQKINLAYFYEEVEQKETGKEYEDFLREDSNAKIVALRKIIDGRKFNELDRKLRQELVGIDGATVIDSEGNIIAIGAIIKIEAGSSGGGRLAATKTLAKYGVAIKISADGFMQGFKMDRQKLRVMPIFIIG